MNRSAEWGMRCTTTGSVGLLVLIAARSTCTCCRIRRPAALGGGAHVIVGGWMIVAASTMLLADSRAGPVDRILPWVLLGDWQRGEPWPRT